MAEGTDIVKIISPATILRMANVIWRFTIAAIVLIVEVRTRNTAVVIWMRWERSLTSSSLSDNFATLHPAPTSAQDGIDHLQLVLVLIFS